MLRGIQCACTIHCLRVVSAIGLCVCGPFSAMGAPGAWLEWSARLGGSGMEMRYDEFYKNGRRCKLKPSCTILPLHNKS